MFKRSYEICIGSGRPNRLLVSLVLKGCVGQSFEIDLWLSRYYAYLSIGHRYDGGWWARAGHSKEA